MRDALSEGDVITNNCSQYRIVGIEMMMVMMMNGGRTNYQQL